MSLYKFNGIVFGWFILKYTSMVSVLYRFFSIILLVISFSTNNIFAQAADDDRICMPYGYPTWYSGNSFENWANSNTCAFFGGTVEVIVPLPIELSYFNAIALEDKVELKWLTSSEKNNDFFTIEKSINGSDWEVVNKIKGAGDSKQEISYVAYDHLPFQGDSYYRLKQTDFNGMFSYSDIQIVTFESEKEASFNFYPNPVTDIISIQGYDINKVVVLSSMGKIVIQEVFNNQKQVVLDLSELKSGIYFLKIGNETKRIVKQ